MYKASIVEFCTIFQSPTIEKASGDFDLRQLTMTAASAARTALCYRFGFSETGSLASVGAGAPSVHRFCEEELFWRGGGHGLSIDTSFATYR